MILTNTMQKFILHWGEMGTRWGVNRTVAQIHALLFLANEPLHAEDIGSTLAVARSNVSTSIRELQSWGLVRTIHVLGDRRDHFETQKDVWDVFFTIAEERKKRELDPTLTMLRECVMSVTEDGTPPPTAERIEETLAFLEQAIGWFDQVKNIDRAAIVRILALGARIQDLMGSK